LGVSGTNLTDDGLAGTSKSARCKEKAPARSWRYGISQELL